MHVITPSPAQLPRNKSETGNSHLVSGSTLLVEETKKNKPQGSHKQGFGSSPAEEPAAKQCDQTWSQDHLFYSASMMVCRTPPAPEVPSLTLVFQWCHCFGFLGCVAACRENQEHGAGCQAVLDS